jgi:hypothetical protein
MFDPVKEDNKKKKEKRQAFVHLVILLVSIQIFMFLILTDALQNSKVCYLAHASRI